MSGLIVPNVTGAGASASGADFTPIAGSDGTTIRPLKTDSTGALVLAVEAVTIGTVGIDQSVPGTTNGVQVNAALPAGTNNIGNVGGKTVAVTVTPTVTTANAYGTNYVVGGLLTFANAFTSKGSGIVQSISVTCKRVESMGWTLFLFAGNPSNTTWTDAAVANINAADISIVRGPILFTNNSSGLGTMTTSFAPGIGIAMSTGSTSLYGVLVSNAALTNNFTTTSDISVTATVLQDV